ncbi:hypothetical protein SNEBB_006380, partial [Seison nebaliae]
AKFSKLEEYLRVAIEKEDEDRHIDNIRITQSASLINNISSSNGRLKTSIGNKYIAHTIVSRKTASGVRRIRVSFLDVNINLAKIVRSLGEDEDNISSEHPRSNFTSTAITECKRLKQWWME